MLLTLITSFTNKHIYANPVVNLTCFFGKKLFVISSTIFFILEWFWSWIYELPVQDSAPTCDNNDQNNSKYWSIVTDQLEDSNVYQLTDKVYLSHDSCEENPSTEFSKAASGVAKKTTKKRGRGTGGIIIAHVHMLETNQFVRMRFVKGKQQQEAYISKTSRL